MTVHRARTIFVALVGLGLSLLFAAGLQARQDVRVPRSEPIVVPAWQRTVAALDWSRVIYWCEASTVNFKTPRGFDETLLAEGWQAWRRTAIDPQVTFARQFTKSPRILIHNPYGVERDGPYRFEQRRLCQRNKLTRHLAYGLGDVLRDLIDEGVQPIVYFGKFPETGAVTHATIQDWLWMIREVTEAGASVAFDASHGYPKDDPRSQFILLIDSIQRTSFGARAIGEPRWSVANMDMLSLPSITQDQLWDRFDPQKHPEASWAARNDQLKGEVIRFCQYPDNDDKNGWGGTTAQVAERLARHAARIQADGHTAALTTGAWQQAWGKP